MCDYGIGLALVQRDETGERPIAFSSRLLTKAERNYSITEKECLALVWAVKKFHSSLWGAEVKVAPSNSKHTNWDEILPYITFAYNTSRQESTGETPYGRKARLPMDITMGVSASGDYTGPGAWAQNLEIARAEVGKRLIEVQERQKQRYEAQHRPAKEFQQGEEVLVYKPFRKVGRAEKLLNRWLGPYTVVRRTSSLNYEVTRPRSKQTESVHVVKMKRFIRKDEQTMADTEKSTKLTEDVPTDTHQEKPSEESTREGEITTAPQETRCHSERVRRALDRYNAAETAIGAVFLLMGLLAPLLGVGTAEGRHLESFSRDGVIFKSQEDIFFSDSGWVVVTDVSFTPIETALAALRRWYVGQMRDDPRGAEAKEGERLHPATGSNP